MNDSGSGSDLISKDELQDFDDAKDSASTQQQQQKQMSNNSDNADSTKDERMPVARRFAVPVNTQHHAGDEGRYSRRSRLCHVLFPSLFECSNTLYLGKMAFLP